MEKENIGDIEIKLKIKNIYVGDDNEIHETLQAVSELIIKELSPTELIVENHTNGPKSMRVWRRFRNEINPGSRM